VHSTGSTQEPLNAAWLWKLEGPKPLKKQRERLWSVDKWHTQN